MKLRRLIALVMSLAIGFASYPFVRLAAQVVTPGVPSQQAINGLAVSGTVAQSDRKTAVANTCLRLRKLDTNAIVASTASDPNGAFSFSVSEPGMYVVEAVDCKKGSVLAVSDALTLAQSSLTTLLVLPTAVAAGLFSSTALLVIAAASAAGITAAALGRGENTPSIMSPEQ